VVDHRPERLETVAFDAMDAATFVEVERRAVPGVEVTPSVMSGEEVVGCGCS
jgi:hypothetical protein